MAALQQQDATLGPALRSGHYAPLKTALGQAIWQHGRRFGREELLVRSTGRGLDPAPYLAYLRAKYSPGAGLQ
jgi:carboxypeptidase Taq